MATFIETIESSFSDQLVANLKLVDRFWTAVRHPALRVMATTSELSDELLAKLGDLVPTTDEDLQRLQAIAKRWTGFGVNVRGEVPALALFFQDDTVEILELLPPSIQALGPELVPRVQLRAIPPRRKTGALMAGSGVVTARPGSPIDWTGVGCERAASDGTLGAFLDDGTGGTWILSANHVLSQNGACPKNEVDIPGLGTVSTQTCPVMIRDFPGVNAADAAVARWTADVSMDTGVPEVPPLVSRIAVLPGGTKDWVVAKAGANTKTTRGLVAYLAEKVTVNLFPMPFSDAEFADQILIIAEENVFSNDGDSGSLVVLPQKDVSVPLGLLVFNGLPARENPQPIFSAATPLENVFGALTAATGKVFSIIASEKNDG